MSGPDPRGSFGDPLCDPRKQRLRVEFDRHDLNGDGRITLGEFIHWATTWDPAITTEQCEIAFALMDDGASGAVDFDTFYHWWSRRAGS